MNICPECGCFVTSHSTKPYCAKCHPDDNESKYLSYDFGRPGYVYFIQSSTGPIKIGWGAVPRARYMTIQNNSPVPLTLLATEPAPKHRERQLHWRFREHRLHGEWFQPTEELMQYIAGLEVSDG